MKEIIRKILIVLFTCLLVFSLYKFISYFYEGYQSEKNFSQLKDKIEEETGKEMTFFEKYRDLINQNPDLAAWISIEDTKVDYPVMLTPSDEEFYLRRNFDKEYEFRGTPFFNATANLKEVDDNIIIYAHNMDDGTMFGALRKYSDYQYYKQHSKILLETLYEKAEYEIFSVFTTVDNPSHELYIDYYKFINANDENAFNEQIKKYKNASYYETGITPVYGDKLLTLSTCEYSNENGRLVVVARKVK